MRPCGAEGYNLIHSIHLKEALLVCFSDQCTLHALTFYATRYPNLCNYSDLEGNALNPFYHDFILLRQRYAHYLIQRMKPLQFLSRRVS